MRKKVQIGDLVTFNCGGSKGKTLALVLDIREGRPMRRAWGEVISAEPAWIQVQWIQVSQLMPRVHPPAPRSGLLQPGDIAVHPATTAFEVTQ